MTAYENIMQAALKILSRKKMTIQETTQRLVKNFPDDQPSISQCIQRLQEMDYLNDYSYVQAYARDRMKFRARGISLIKMELRKKGLSKNLIDEALFQIFPTLDEFSAAEKLTTSYIKKSSFRRGNSRERKNRLTNFLLSKGFSFQVIFSVIDKLSVLE